MARPVVWTQPAADDLEAAVTFVARDSEAYACSLAQLAIDGGGVPGGIPESRASAAGSQAVSLPRTADRAYRLVYLVERERVLIVAFLHGHRALWQALRNRRGT